jgi:beta-lactamase regulating signal transducer with metallopeptidase domain
MNLWQSFSLWLPAAVSAAELHRLGLVVLHSLWQAVAVAAALAVALQILPRRSAAAVQVRYLLAMLAILSLPVACVVTYAVIEPPRERGAADDDATRAAAVTAPATAAAASSSPGIRARDARPSAIAIPPDIRTAVHRFLQRFAETIKPWLAWCGAMWLAGAVVAAVRLGVGWSLGRRLVAEAAPLADAGWQARLRCWQDALGLRGRIRLVVSARIDAPLVLGWFEPVVIWPLAAVTGMPPDQIDAILAHELSHIRRHDIVANLVQCCIETLFFHHPAAWWISGQVRAEREHCADDLAVRALASRRAGTRVSYATALVALAERRQGAVLAAAANGGSLACRIERLVGIEPAAGHPARLVTAVLVLLAVGGSVAPTAMSGRRAIAAPPQADAAAATAAAFPQDTNAIESLTAEQARTLVAELSVAQVPGVSVQIETGYGPQTMRRCLSLKGLKSVDAETAQAIAGYTIGPILLDGLPTLSDDAARALAQHKRPLSLNGLTTLSDEAARALSQHKGWLSLNGLTTLSDEAAKALGQHDGDWLYLNGLTTLSDAAAGALAQNKCDHLFLNGLTTLSDAAARALSRHKGRHLFLNGLTTLSESAAEALAGKQPLSSISLNGLTSLSAEAATALAKHSGNKLSLNGLTTLSDSAAKPLAQHQGRALALDGLTTLSGEMAESLAQHKGGLSLNGLTTISAETAKAFVQHKGRLSLNGLTTISAETAKAFVQHKGSLSLNGLTTLSAETAKDLAAVESWDGRLVSLTAFSAPDSVAVAQALATRNGPLSLPNLKKISPKTLFALIAKEDVQIPLIETIEFIPEPDGSPTDDFVIPEWLEQRQRRQAGGGAGS